MRCGMVVAAVAWVVCVFVVVDVHAATSYVYNDAVVSPFQDWSWGGGVDGGWTTTTRGGTPRAVRFTPNQWGAFYLHAIDYVSSASWSSIEFWAYRPSGASTNIVFNLIVDATSGSVSTAPTNRKITTLLGGTWPENTWTKGVVSLADYPVGVYDGFFFQDNSGGTTNLPVYFDDIVLVSDGGSSSNASTTSTPPTAAATTRAPTTTTTTTRAASTTTTTSAPTTTTTRAANGTTTTTTRAASTTTTTRTPTTTTTASPTTTTTTARPVTTTTTSSGGTKGADVDADVLALYNTITTGSATYYGDYSNGGACMLDPTPPVGTGCKHTVAIANYMASKTCGMCVEVTGAGKGSGDAAYAVNGTRIVYVNNQCPNCPTGLLDFGLTGDGKWDITWKAVPCPITSNIQYVIKSGSSIYWIGIQPRNTVHPVYKLAINVKGVWTYLPRMDYNYFVASFSGLAFPIQIQMTSVKGEVITDTIQSLQIGVSISGNVQFTP